MMVRRGSNECIYGRVKRKQDGVGRVECMIICARVKRKQGGLEKVDSVCIHGRV